MRSLALLVLVLLAACTPLHERMSEEISSGDSADKVKSEFGTPVKTETSDRSPDVQTWYYAERGVVCAVILDHEAVRSTGCDATHYVGGAKLVGAFLQGMGQGLQRSAANRQSVDCTSSSSGDTTYTHCQ